MPDFIDSNHIFTSPVRKFKANDPYYWEVDNIPLSQLEQNNLWLKDQVAGLLGAGAGPGGGGTGVLNNIKRTQITELRPTVAGTTVTVEPGVFTARVNDAYSPNIGTDLTSQPDDPNGPDYLGGPGVSWDTKNPAEVQAAINKIYSTVATDSLKLNGLIERFQEYAVYKVGLGDYVDTGSTVTSTDLGDNLTWTGFPLLNSSKFYNLLGSIFTNSSNISYTQTIAKEFTKRWRGIARTSIVDVAEPLTIDIPLFNANDYFYYDANGVATYPGGVTKRIDLVFIYTKTIDQGEAAVIDRGGVTTITEPKLGVVVGAGLGLDLNEEVLAAGVYATVAHTPNGTSTQDGDYFMLASPADAQTQAGGGITLPTGKVYGSFPSPDDLLNLAPLLANDIESGDWRTIGQSVLPVAYVVVTQGATNIPSTSLFDIRPLLRTAELTYDERSGVAGAIPSLSLANPAVGKRELQSHVATIVNNAFGTAAAAPPPGDSTPLAPRVIGGGYVWGGKKWGPEGAITTALGNGDWLGNGVYNMGYNDVPDNPDWDWATWTAYLDPTKDGAGLHKNDWINWKYAVQNNVDVTSNFALDFQELGGGNDESIFTNSFGTNIGKPLESGRDGVPAPIMMYWVKKRFWFDGGSLPAGFNNYCVKAYFSNCVPLSTGSLATVSPNLAESGGTRGIWITKGSGWFEINVGWTGPDPYQEIGAQWAGWSADRIKSASFPSSNRDTNKFRSWAVLHPSLPVTQVATGGTAANPMESRGTGSQGFVPSPTEDNPEIKVDSVGVCTYPTIVFEIIGFPSDWDNNGFQLYNSNMPHNGTATIVVR